MSRSAGLSWSRSPTGMRSVRPGRYFWRAVFRTVRAERRAGIYVGHPVRVDRITTTFSIRDDSDVRRGQEGLKLKAGYPIPAYRPTASSTTRERRPSEIFGTVKVVSLPGILDVK